MAAPPASGRQRMLHKVRGITQFVQLKDPHSYREDLGKDKGDRRADKVVVRDQSHKKE